MTRFRLTPAAAPTAAAPAAALAIGLLLGGGVGTVQAACRFLIPIGGGGQPVVEKRIGPDRLVGRTNWNTDFAVDRSFASFRVNFQSASTGQGTFPLQVFLVFTDGSNLRLVNDNLTLAPGQQRRLGPFPAVPGKRASKVNVRVGSSAMPGSTGFSYRVSVEGCN
jgi:hypothetical protein